MGWLYSFIYGVVGYILLNMLYRCTNHYKNAGIVYRAFKKGVPQRLRFVNLGSTYSQFAFNCFDEMGLDRAYNLALPCESVEADYEKLKIFSSHLEKGCVVAITLAPCSLLYCWGQLDEGEKHYDFMPRRVKKDWKLQSFIRFYLPLFPFRFAKIGRIVFDSQRQKDIVDAYASRFPSRKEIQEKAKEMAELWMHLFGLDDLRHPVEDGKNVGRIQYNVGIIVKMIDFCIGNQFIPIIVVPPFLGELNDFFSTSFINSTLGLVFDAVKDHDIKIYDCRTEKEFQSDPTLYVDGFFCLNKYGAEKFVKLLSSKMNEDGLNVNNGTLREWAF